MAIIISSKHLDEKKHVWIALSSTIYGIGKTTALKLCTDAKINPHVKLSELTDAEIDNIRSLVAGYTVESELKRLVATNIMDKQNSGSYVGRRHRAGLPVRGQNTKNNAQTCKRRRGRKKKS